jgi:ABC-2 type transport system permease protein
MFTIYKLTIASIKGFVRSTQALFFTLFMPLIIMLIFGYIGFDKPTKIDVGLVTSNPTPATANFIEQIKQFPTFAVHEGSLDAERVELDEGNRAVILEVPDNAIPSGARAPEAMVAHTNAGKVGEVQAVLSILNQYINQMTLTQANIEPIVKVEEKEINSNNLRYIEFLLPGLIALSIMQMGVFSVAFVFTQYKEKGVLKRILATPMRPIHFVAANVITRLLVSLVQAAIFIVVGILLFQVDIVGSYWLMFLCVLLGALMFLGLGFSISGIAKTVDSVPAIGNLVVFPMLFLGGTFFPIANMPPWLQMFAQFLPLTYFSTALRDVMTKGAGFFDIGWDIAAMVIWAIILITLATVTFRFQEKESA